MDAGANPVASGSCSYPTGATGVLGYIDLSGFSVTIGSDTYTLADVAGFTDYRWFAYDTGANVFDTGTGLCGFSGCNFNASLAAVNSSGSSGFFFTPAPGSFADYQHFSDIPFSTIQLTSSDQGSSVPEPASMLLLGTGLAAAAARRRRNQRS